MKPTKKIELEVLKVYDAWLQSYLNGDTKTYNQYLDDEYHFIGSTNNEEFLNRKDTTAFFQATADQLAGKSEMRNTIRTVESFEGLIFITDLFDAYILMESEWRYYGRFRFSSTLRKNKEGWRFIYQHFSVPDSKAQEGETLGTEQISKENQELRDAIKRRTVELEHKNKELEIERSLEKVRAQAMGMKKAEDLPNVCEILYEELKTLGFSDLRNAMINIHDDEKSTFNNYDYSDEIGKSITPLFYDIHPVIKKQIKTIRSSDDAFSETVFKGKDLESWNTFRKSQGEKDDKRITNSKALYYYFYSIGTGSIGISTFNAISKEKQEVLKLFRNVFAFAYRRYMDVAQAEAQAKEAQIEAALERVRSRSMAMHKSEELIEAGALLYQELSKLGIQNLTTGYVLFDEAATMGWNYGVNPMDGSIRHKPVGMNHSKNKVMKAIASSWKKQDPLLVIQFNEKETIKHQTFIAEESIGFPISKEQLLAISPKRLVVHTFNFQHGYLLIVGGELLSSAQQEMITRFAKVFDQTYTRFLDLQKAEAQTKDAQIEAALERVRSRSMAMHKSEELKDVIQVVFEQLVALNFQVEHAGFIMDYIENDDMHIWLTDKHEVPSQLTIPYFDSPHWNSFNDAKENGLDFFSNHLEFKEKNKFYKALFKLIPDVPQETSDYYLACVGLDISTVLLDNVGLYIENFKGLPYSDEENKTLMRFGKVFQQTYTRFQDLQKAEAQIREARIETALERMRAVALNIRTTKEVLLVAESMYNELKLLDFRNIRNAQIVIDLKDNDTYLVCIHSDDSSEIIRESRYETSPIIQQLYNELDASNDAFYRREMKGAEFKKWLKWRKSITDTVDKRILEAKSISFYLFSIGEGHLGISAFNTISEEKVEILQRFRNVFEMTYRRFIELQKSEAQAREVLIELALERVRARTMAMQKSDELREAGGVLYRELTNLDITSLTIGYVLMDESEKIGWNYTANPADGTIWEFAVGVPHDETDFMRAVKHSWQEREPFSVIKMDAKQTIIHQTFIAERGINFPYTAKELISFSPEKIVLYSFNFQQGYLLIVGDKELQKEQEEMLVRFTNVFQQTYTRFLDLEKAEAQTRESQINLAVERVRAKALAMHKSEEIMEVVAKLKEEVMSLDIPDVIAATIFLKEGDDNVRMWDLSTLEKNNDGYQIPFDITFKLKKTDPNLYIKRVWENQNNYFFEKQEAKDFKRIIAWLRENNKIAVADEVEAFIAETKLQCLHHVVKKLNNGKLVIDLLNEPSTEMETILTKMGAAFDLAYKRFEDLLNSEAQTKEARIEAALERVRSRSMAMHKSEELLDVISVVSEQLLQLEFKFIHVSFANNDTGQDYKFWTSSKGMPKPMRFTTSYLNIAVFNNLRDAQEKLVPFFTDIITKKEHNLWHTHLLKHGGADVFSKEENEFIMSRGMARSIAINPNIILILANYASIPYSDSENKIIERFAKVFEQSYTRFLDLQRAEKQAKEFKIEASLEKVRNVALSLTKSEDMLDIAKVLYEQLLELGFTDIRNAIIDIHNDDNESFTDYDYSHDMSSAITHFSFYGDPVIEEQIKKIESSNDAFFEIELKGEQLDELIETRLRNGEKDDPRLRQTDHLTYNLYSFGNGAIGISNFGVLTETQKTILKRFRNVFTFAYQRYSDLALAEVQARKAQIETALETVRLRTMAMQSSDELSETAVVVFKQLMDLGIEPNRLYIGIIADESGDIEFWATDEDGSKISTKFTGNINKNKSIQKMYDGWTAKEKSLIIDMKGKELEAYFHYLGDVMHVPFKDGLSQKRRVQTMSFFSKGFIGIAAPEEQPESTTKVLERFAGVFNLTYTRFKDLKIAEANAIQAEQDLILLQTEKKKAEDALTELQHTQKQLIQSEKMASLGELTAGIAHEIQNPLNFVNNFSELSNELIDEMSEEIEKGDMKEAKYIMADIKSNLEKINHHGKRAEAIVKGMLQHSRTSSAEKEPTDINKLADEYFRLAYHGLRAKDRTFNATLETDYDDSIGQIPVIAQDMGRVILNLITNAFYVVDEKKKSGIEDYLPTVKISTKKQKDSIKISVKDNGNGIPKHILDKIFQPFFTTKPTGQGTGLGLSMSYDIVTKAHGGELKAETKEGEGTSFTIILPSKK